MVGPLNLTGVDISILIIAAGAIFIYFGKLIGDTKTQKYDKLDYYIEGLFFSIGYIYVPLIFGYYLIYLDTVFKNYLRYFNPLLNAFNPTWVLIIIQFLALWFISQNLEAHNFRRYRLVESEEFKKRFGAEFKRLKSKNWILKLIAKNKWVKSNVALGLAVDWYGLIIRITNDRVLWLLSFLTFLTDFKMYNSGQIPIFIIFSLPATMFILTFIALAYGFNNAKYPDAKVYLEDGTILNGQIIKFGDFVFVLDHNDSNKKLFVNKDKVRYVSEELFSKNANV